MLPALPAEPDRAPAGVVYPYDENSVLTDSKSGVPACDSRRAPACEAPEKASGDSVQLPQSASGSPVHHVAYPVDNETPSCSAITSCMPGVCSS